MKQIDLEQIAEVAGGVTIDPETGRGCTEHGPLFPVPFNPLPGKFERATGVVAAP
ncbi:hypothetical protein [Lysobacter sp. TAB13]|uniref:hypothetical protein n=1 Tax=Lysobacter sp. TAB13 TaxID=3233065 RepID=UPI003F9ABAA7